MKKFIVFDEVGTLKYRLIEGIHKIPTEAVHVPEALWSETMQDVESTWSIDKKGIISKRQYVQPVMPPEALISNKRYDHEIAGITHNGIQLDTDRQSQALLNGAAIQAMLDPSYSVRWKTRAGFIELNAKQILEVTSAVQAHVQACFDREAQLLAAIEDKLFTPEIAQQGWPGPVPPRPSQPVIA